MLLKYYKRGNTFSFSSTFHDADDEVIAPASVAIFISFIDAAGDRVTEEIEMTDDTAGEWSADWDSSVAKKGRVHWSIQSEGPSSAQDGIFQLEANLANPDPEESA